jgi:hypothetical protein
MPPFDQFMTVIRDDECGWGQDLVFPTMSTCVAIVCVLSNTLVGIHKTQGWHAGSMKLATFAWHKGSSAPDIGVKRMSKVQITADHVAKTAFVQRGHSAHEGIRERVQKQSTHVHMLRRFIELKRM